jgi:hypothetical protein
MESAFKEELMTFIHLLEQWEEAYVNNLTRRGVEFQKKVDKVKSFLNDKTLEYDSLSQEQRKEIRELILRFQSGIGKYIEQLETKTQGLKKSQSTLNRILKHIK